MAISKRFRPCSISTLLILLTLNVASQELITDRPDQTEASRTIMRGSLQIESGFLFMEGSVTSYGDLRTISFPSTLFRLGVTDRFELRLQSGYTHERYYFGDNPIKLSGFNDLEAGFKFHLFASEDGKSSFALLSHLGLPSGSPYFSSDRLFNVTKLAGSRSLGDKCEFGYNLGFNWDKAEKFNLSYSAVTGFSIGTKGAFFSEIYGETNNYYEFLVNFDAGVTYLVTPYLQVDISLGTGINNKMNFLNTGFCWNINNLQEPF